ncbi:MAG TPA: DUF1326 domain-containing protein [Polyangia bacterium]|nr:DUF1326 domain-containing protein [Casimicrobiaceae bacterium]
MTPWEIQGRELINCNCSYGCPCQFGAPPSKGYCEAMGGLVIDKGHYGDVSLDGTRMAVVLAWPGPIHQGKGRCQPIVDASASAAQRDALLRIMSGQDTDPFATMFAVFATTYEKVFEPIVTPIEIDIDVDARRGRVRAAGVLEVDGEPIRNPVSGAEHRARIDLPHGFEYEFAEIGSGTSRSTGPLALQLAKTYAQFARIHLDNHGVVRHRAAA